MKPVIRSVTPLEFVWATQDPFLFCVHHNDEYPEGNDRFGPKASLAGRDIGQDFDEANAWRMYHGDVVPGFPNHPHRGFETITVARRGYIDHSDSLGATARFGQGDVQWMTAGRGIVHCEMFPLLDPAPPNPGERVEVWRNRPRKKKLGEPHVSMVWRHRVPVRTFTDAAGRKTVVTITAGALEGTAPPPPPPNSWAAQPESDVAVWSIQMEPDATWTLPPTRPTSRRTLYLFRGSATIAGESVHAKTGVGLQADAPVEIHALGGPAELLLLQGRPIGEPVVQYGPFVMNSPEEIQQAFLDYRRTEFGGWPWPRHDPVHPKDAGRFARHADGRVEHAPADAT